jgi:iron complex transport system ATP-binding protein
MFCDTLIVMQQGRIVASGIPEEVLTESLLKNIFSVEARIEISQHHSRPHIHYLR